MSTSARRSKSPDESARVARKTTVSRSAISTRIPALPSACSISTPDAPNWLARKTIFDGSKRPAGKSLAVRKMGRENSAATFDVNDEMLARSAASSSCPRVSRRARTASMDARGAPAGEVVCVVSKDCSMRSRLRYFP